MKPVRLLGRHGLPIFATGTVLAIFAQAVKEVHPGGFLQDSVLILGGLSIQWAFAAIRERIKRPAQPAVQMPVIPVPGVPALPDPHRFATAAR